MSNATIAELQERARQLHGQYSFRFAGHPRITRDIKLLDRLTEDTRALRDEVASAPGNGAAQERDELLAQLEERVDLYGKERASIEEARAEGPAAREASILGTRANFIIGRYRRHFAGKDRATRDISLLNEMIQDLQKVKDEMRLLFNVHPLDQLGRDVDVVSQNLETYIRERAEVLTARERMSIPDRASNLATLANNQFRLYDVHFAGKSRLTRRPGLLRRIVDALGDTQKQMQDAKARGLLSDANDRNIGIVDGRLELYRNELTEIERLRQQTSLNDLAGSLGGAANDLLAAYGEHFAGQNRATRDLDLLDNLCDQMGEIERQMHNLSLQENIEINNNNLGIVRDALSMFEREHQEIVKSRSSNVSA